MARWKWLFMVFAMAVLMGSCTHMQDVTHNEAGGYIPACGELPGVIGDDC